MSANNPTVLFSYTKNLFRSTPLPKQLLHFTDSTPLFIVYYVWETSTPQISEVELPLPHGPNKQAAAQFNPSNFSYFHTGPICKLSSTFLPTFLFPLPPPVCAPDPEGRPGMTDSRARRRAPPACPLVHAEALPGIRRAQRRGGGPGWYRSIPSPPLLPVLFGSLVAASCWILVALRSAAWWEARGREWVLFVGGLAVPCSDRPGN